MNNTHAVPMATPSLLLRRVLAAIAGVVFVAVSAQVALKARVPNDVGMLEFRDAGTTISDPDRGFTFNGLFPGAFSTTEKV